MDYTDLFFDLDGTLWDFRANSEDTQLELYRHFQLDRYFHDFHIMKEAFMELNNRLWQSYREGEIDRERLKWYRFSLLLKKAGIEDVHLARELDRFYLGHSPFKTKLIAGAMNALDYLSGSYRLHIITNGFNDVQFLKIKNSGLSPYFKTITTAEHAGSLKPDPHIFELALQRADARPHSSIMIGDQYDVDIVGARQAGMDQVYLMNQESPPKVDESTYRINGLEELTGIF
jgi:putative hydrolase of the HAD superfamily